MPSPSGSTQLPAVRVWTVIAVLGLGLGCRKTEPVPKGDILATLTAPTITGEPFDASTLRGRPSFVMFVSPTCPHCIEEIPAAQRVAQAGDANAVAVFIVGKAENARGVVDHLKFEGPALIDDGTLRKRYGVRSVPYTLVLGADGHAKAALRGAFGVSGLEAALADAR